MNKFTERLQEEVEHSDWLTDRLKCVAKSIENLGLEQPEKCLFGYGGSCGYPIEDCLNCPCQEYQKAYERERELCKQIFEIDIGSYEENKKRERELEEWEIKNGYRTATNLK